jgi:hypothetical protein
MRSAVIVFVWALANIAYAQHCDAPIPATPDLKLTLAFENATYKTSSYQGEYQGVLFNTAWGNRWVFTRAMLPSYRIYRNGLTDYGIGDLLVDIQVPILKQDQLSSGLGLAFTAPTGDMQKGLGMGHWMLMPKGWVAWRGTKASAQLQVAYGSAVKHGNTSTHRHGGPAPLVNPMNASEIEASTTLGYLLHTHFKLQSGIYGAVPIAVEEGRARMNGFIGGTLIFDHLDVCLETHLPIVGDAFITKIIGSVGYRF